jgi:predicted esterase
MHPLNRNLLKTPGEACAVAFLTVGLLAVALPQPAGSESRELHVTRAEFSASYLRFEEALSGMTLDPGEAARVNREFDALTLLFFQKNYSRAVRKLHELTVSLGAGKVAADAVTAAMSLAVRVMPPVIVLGSGDPDLRVESLYDWTSDTGEIDLAVEIRKREMRQNETAAVRVPFRADFRSGGSVDIELPFALDPSRLEPGMYDLGIVYEKEFIRTGSWTVVREDLDVVRERNSGRIAALHRDLKKKDLDDARASVEARNGLLSQLPSPENTAQAVLDLSALAAAVDTEIEALGRGENPYRGRRGDTWRVISDGQRRVPMRLYAPESARPDTPLPLVVAFHGAGGDENMFMEGYGAGLIRRLAETYGVLVASPFTNAFAGPGGPALFQRMLEILTAEYPLDPGRIYLLGHSMGAGVVNRLCAERPNRIAAAACLSGFQGFADSVAAIPPVLVIAAELDPLASPARIEPPAVKAAERGLPVTYRMIPGYGHTLVVARELPAVFQWLMTHTLSARLFRAFRAPIRQSSPVSRNKGDAPGCASRNDPRLSTAKQGIKSSTG